MGSTASGQVVNLMSNDVFRFDLVCVYCLKYFMQNIKVIKFSVSMNLLNFHYKNIMILSLQTIGLFPFLFVGPLEVLVVSILLWFYIGWSGICGMLVLLLVIPLMGGLAKVFARLRLWIKILHLHVVYSLFTNEF